MRTLTLVSQAWKAAAALVLAVLLATPAWAGKYASIVIDMDSAQVLHARNADDLRYPASLTKVMTLYLTFDALDSGKLKLTDRIPVSKHAAGQAPSKLGLKAGSSIRVDDAINALVTKSANDVAMVLAEKLGGSQTKFAIMMNDKADELGMENTTFYNPSGLPDARQVTTARDMAKLAEAILIDHKDRYTYFATPRFTYNKRTYKNHNELLAQVEGVDGIKTGYTNASGYNLMASAKRGDHRVIAIMMGGTTGKSRDAHVADLIEAAFLQLGGGDMMANADLVERLSWGERSNSTADDLALAQLRKFMPADPAPGAGEAVASFMASAPAAAVEALMEAATDEGDDADDGVPVAGEDAGAAPGAP
jgi:D-alanyl-D-alanine carboxypeptidase